MLKRTTLKIDEDLDARLRHEAERRGTTISEINRAALEAYLGSAPRGTGPRRRFLAEGAGNSGYSSISEQIEELLREEVQPSR